MTTDRSEIARRTRSSPSVKRELLQRTGNIINAKTSILIVFLAIQLFGVLFVPRYADLTNLWVILQAVPTLGIVSLGITLLMIAGEFDLSVGAVFLVGPGVMAVLFVNYGISLWIGLLAGLVAGICLEVLNGLVTVKTRIPSFIATLGSMMVIKGAAYRLAGGRPVNWDSGTLFKFVFAGKIGFMPMQFIWFVFLATITYLILERHEFGNRVLATGGSKQVARALGINTNRVKITCFALVGLFAALAGVMESTRMSSVYMQQGDGLNLNAIAAAVIGGTSLAGGSGSIIGAFLGAIIIFSLQDILLLMRVDAFYFQSYVGAVIILAVVLNTAIALRKK